MKIKMLGVASLSALFLMGCGSSDGSLSGGSGRGFVVEANEICAGLDAKIDEIAAEATDPNSSSEPDMEEMFGDLVDVYRDLVDEIDGLGTNGVDSSKVDDLVDALRDGVAEIERGGLASLEGDEPEGFKAADKIASELGLDDCDQD